MKPSFVTHLKKSLKCFPSKTLDSSNQSIQASGLQATGNSTTGEEGHGAETAEFEKSRWKRPGEVDL